MKKLIYISVLISLACQSYSQFEVPRLSQYLNNGLAINPAYAGSREALSGTLVYRSLYQGFEGNPKGFLAAAHTPMKDGNVALGVTIENKSYPGYNNTGLYGHYAYRMWLKGMRLSFGLRAGLYSYDLDYTELDLMDPTDPEFSSEKGLSPNFGTGVYIYNNDFFFGFSVPYLLNLPDRTSKIRFDPASYRYILTAGYLWHVSDAFSLKPSTLIEYSKTGLDIQGGFNYILMDDNLWLGTLYRFTSRTLTAVVEFQASSPWRIGIAYDWSFTDISRVSNGSFEIMLRYELNFVSNIESPFYF